MLSLLPLFASLLSAVSPPSGSIDEQTFLSRVRSTETELIRAEEAVALAEADLLRARALQAPEVSWSMERPSGEIRQDTHVLAWSPPIEQGRRHAIRASGMTSEAARHTRDAARLEHRRRAREVFAEWALRERRVEIQRGHRARLEGAAERLRARVEGGEAAGLAARRISVEVAQARLDLTRAEAELERVRRLVSAWCPSGCIDLQPELPTLPDVPSAPAANSPMVEAARAEVRAAEAGLYAAAASLAAPRIEAGWQRQDEPEAVRTGPVAGIAWPIPIGGPRRANRATAQARLESAKARLEWSESLLSREIEGVRAAYVTLRADAVASEGLLQSATHVAEASSEAFALGGVPLTDLLDAWRTAREVGLQILDIHGDAAAAHRRLEALGGVR
jgi:outer membrane protein TolC